MTAPTDLAVQAATCAQVVARNDAVVDDFKIFTSMRCDSILVSSEDNSDLCHRRIGSKLYMPDLHRQRLSKAVAQFWPTMRFAELETAESFESALSHALEERERLHETYMCPMKIKYTLMSSGRTTLELQPVPALPLEALFPTTFRLPSSRHSSAHGAKRYGSSNPTPIYHTLPYLPSSSMYSDLPPRSRAGSNDSWSSSSDSSSSSASSRHARSTLPCTYEIFIDTEATVQDPHTSFKTTHRPHYTLSRTRALPYADDVTQEVLLWNPQGFITEGSLTTPYFYRRGRWVTPPVEGTMFNTQPGIEGQEKEEHGGQRGTSRQWALWKGLAEEGHVEARSIRDGERVWLSNGVRGFGWGKVKLIKRYER